MATTLTPRRERLRLVMVRRVSTVGQAVDGYGLDAQDADCRRWNRSLPTEHRIVHSVVDGDKTAPAARAPSTNARA